MGLYHEHILPHLIDFTCGMKLVNRHRSLLIPQACGAVLEIGLGSGLNLPHYRAQQIQRFWALEPSAGMRRKAQERIAASDFAVEWLDLPDNRIPLPDHSVDTIVITYTLCTIPDTKTALQEMRRVIKPDGQLLFSEHGKAPDQQVRLWQERLTPAWRSVSGGCHLNRDIPHLLHCHGFDIISLEAGYMRGSPRFAGYNFRGIAQPSTDLSYLKN
jgi:SAM-dependent methyltransferase